MPRRAYNRATLAHRSGDTSASHSSTGLLPFRTLHGAQQPNVMESMTQYETGLPRRPNGALLPPTPTRLARDHSDALRRTTPLLPLGHHTPPRRIHQRGTQLDNRFQCGTIGPYTPRETCRLVLVRSVSLPIHAISGIRAPRPRMWSPC